MDCDPGPHKAFITKIGQFVAIPSLDSCNRRLCLRSAGEIHPSPLDVDRSHVLPDLLDFPLRGVLDLLFFPDTTDDLLGTKKRAPKPDATHRGRR